MLGCAFGNKFQVLKSLSFTDTLNISKISYIWSSCKISKFFCTLDSHGILNISKQMPGLTYEIRYLRFTQFPRLEDTTGF